MNMLALAPLEIQGTPSQSDADTPQQTYDWNALSAREQQRQQHKQQQQKQQQ